MVRQATRCLALSAILWWLPQASLGSTSPPLDQFGSVRKIYPMPARGPVKVDVLGPGSGAASIRIVQPTGRVVRRFRFEGLTPRTWQFVDIDVSGLPTGVYFLWYSDSTERGIKAGRRLVIKR